MNNREFAALNPLFQFSCEAAKIKPSRRQASKWRNGKGKAFNHRFEGQKLMDAKPKKEKANDNNQVREPEATSESS